MTKEELYQLTTKFLNETLSVEEKERLEKWYRKGVEEDVIVDISSRSGHTSESELSTRLLQQIRLTLANQETHVAPVRYMRRGWWAAAAVLVLVGSTALFVFLNNNSNQQLANGNKHLQNDIAPGSNRATLTLADGSTILLDEAKDGNLTQQGNAKVIKLGNGQLAYRVDNELSGEMVYNTMTVPKGGQYQLTLPDGSKVWLNAASSIRYPTSFAGADRKVDITGEVYMEIAKNTKQPFKVGVNGMEVQVLGTSFNINAYEDESVVKTTLITGSVKVIRGNSEAILNPGEQAQGAASSIKVNKANVDEVTAWKNGLFSFSNATIQSVMRQISRWYSVDIVYEGNVPTQRFFGEMHRDLTLSQVLKGLEVSNVHFRLENRKLIVLP